MIDRISTAGTGTQEPRLLRLKTVCSEFEAIFLSHLLRTMRSSVCGEGLFGKSHQGEIMGTMVDEKLALDMAKKRGIGVGDLLFRKLQTVYRAPETGRKHGTENHPDD